MLKIPVDQVEEPVPTVKVRMEGSRGARVAAALAAPTTPPGTPEVIGGYRVICSLGVGGMAQVYLCHAKGIGGFHKLLVLKVPRPDVIGDPDTMEMFLNEARIAGRLNHPNVVQTNEVGLSDGAPFMAMEFLEGQSLSAIQRKIGLEKLSTDFQLRVIANALAGLHYAHELQDYHGVQLGIVHRDISPQNVFVTYDGLTKLLDFGIAKASGSCDLTRDGVIKGKISYIAPEQGALEPVDRRADIFSVGVMIWEAATHQRLVPMGTDELAVLRRRIAGEDPKAHEVAANVPPELSEICSRAMARRPQDRYQTARELKDAVEAYLLNSSRPTESEVGRFVCDAFADQRVEVRLQIDEQLRKRTKPSNTFQSTPPHASESSTSATVMDADSDHVQLARTARPSRSRGTLALSGLLVLVTAGLGISLSLSHWRGASAELVTPASKAPAAALPAAPVGASDVATSSSAEPQPVRIVVRVQPATSQLVVDGKTVAGGVFEADLPPTPAPHQVRASAPGFATSERTVVFDRDVSLEIALAPLVAPRGAPASTSKPKAAASAPAAVPAGAGVRPIDDKDPYERKVLP